MNGSGKNTHLLHCVRPGIPMFWSTDQVRHPSLQLELCERQRGSLHFQGFYNTSLRATTTTTGILTKFYMAKITIEINMSGKCHEQLHHNLEKLSL